MIFCGAVVASFVMIWVSLGLCIDSAVNSAWCSFATNEGPVPVERYNYNDHSHGSRVEIHWLHPMNMSTGGSCVYETSSREPGSSFRCERRSGQLSCENVEDRIQGWMILSIVLGGIWSIIGTLYLVVWISARYRGTIPNKSQPQTSGLVEITSI
jgi:hypothetical protein